jgi:hypothetical protein
LRFEVEIPFQLACFLFWYSSVIFCYISVIIFSGEHPDDRESDDSKKTEKLADCQSLTDVFGALKAKVCYKNTLKQD